MRLELGKKYHFGRFGIFTVIEDNPELSHVTISWDLNPQNHDHLVRERPKEEDPAFAVREAEE